MTRSIQMAIEALKAGQITALPTEGVYGLHLALQHWALLPTLMTTKGRPEDKGFVVVADHLERLSAYLAPLPQKWLVQVRKTWPGPYTWLLPSHPDTPKILTGGRHSIAVRITDHPILKEICATLGDGIISTSANRHGKVPAQSAAEVHQMFTSEEVPVVLDGRLGDLKHPTPIIDVATLEVVRGPAPAWLRSGEADS